MNLQFEGIEKFEIQDHLVIINKNQIGKIIIFWKKLEAEKLVVKIQEKCNIEILELEEKNNSKIEYQIGTNSQVLYNLFAKEKANNAFRKFDLKENARLTAGCADFSSGEKTLEVEINLNEINSSVDWHLACLAQQNDRKIFKINILHNVGLTTANMENYGVCKNSSDLEFLGDAIIKKGAKKAATKQSAKIVLFDKTCHAKASPKLCIYENDVEASHGASEGQINPDHVYYLMSRGLTEDEAKKLITLGYLNPIVKYFNDEKIKKQIVNSITKEI